MNPYLNEKMLHERRQEMLAEAHHRQLIAAYHLAHPPALVRLQMAFGNALIRWGVLLTRRYADRFELPPEMSRQRH